MPEQTKYRPAEIRRVGDRDIEIVWSDGEVTRWSPRRLRDACPCATCREKRSKADANAEGMRGKPMGLPILSAAEAQPLTIAAMKPVGNYAYNIAFSDGHGSGIFTMERLRASETQSEF